jgi:hypothetical protein
VGYNTYLRVSGVLYFLLMAQEKTRRPSRPHELHPIYIPDADEQDTHSVAPSFIYKLLYLHPRSELSIKSYSDLNNCLATFLTKRFRDENRFGFFVLALLVHFTATQVLLLYARTAITFASYPSIAPVYSSRLSAEGERRRRIQRTRSSDECQQQQ